MRPFKFIILLLLAACFIGFKTWTNKVYIKGHIRKNPNDTPAFVSYLAVFVKGDNKVLAKTVTDYMGNFDLSFTPEKEESFDFFCSCVGVDTMLIASVTRFESDTPEMTFFIPAKNKKNASGKVICPKCKRTDNVYKIVYGDNPIYVRNISSSGDTTYSQLYKGTYQEDCSEGQQDITATEIKLNSNNKTR